MTSPNGPILFNSTTGSDSNASGLGPSSAVIGSSAELDGTATVDMSYDGMDLSGISAGDLLFCSTSSGRKFSIIASVDTLSETITTDDVWPTESGVSWSVGGKRATWDNADSRRIFGDDCAAGFLIETETDQSLTSALLIKHGSTTEPVTIQGSTAHKVINQTASTFVMDTPSWGSGKTIIKNIKFTNSNSTKSTSVVGFRQQHQVETHIFENCIFGDATNNLRYGWYTGQYARTVFKSCVFENCEIGVYGYWNPNGSFFVSDCVFRNNTGAYAFYSAGTNYGTSIHNSLFHNNAQQGAFVSEKGDVTGCCFYGNGGDGLGFNASYGNYSSAIYGNIFVSNSGYGIDNSTKPIDTIYNNAFYNNTSGQINGSTDIVTITLTADPFTDAANGDFNLNTSAGGGAVLRSTNYTLGE
jgi:hypothetical protein